VETQRITPTPQQWAHFRRSLDKVKAWRWRPKYVGNYPDSSTWSLKIEYADRSLATTGAAAFPDRSTDKSLPKYAFNRYQLALQELIGRPFGRGVKPIEVYDVSDLRLIATNPAKEEAEQWADFRDPKGKVHRVALHEPVGGRGTLDKVERSTVALLVLARSKDGEWTQLQRSISLPAPKGTGK
jgi:hypothetical protein